MISILEVAKRTRTGQRMDDKEWGMALFKKLQELIVRHDLRQQAPDKFYEVNDDYIHSLFEAGMDFLVEMGVYCTQTHKVIVFSDDEVREAVRETVPQVTMGEGADERVWRKREFGDTTPPGISVAGHGPWSDKMIPLPIVVRELVRHKRVDMIEGFMYANIDGWEVNGPVMRAYAARRAVEKVKDGLTMAGRRGLAVTSYPVLTDAFSMVAPLDAERGLRRGDGGFFTILPDLMVEEDLIAASLVYHELGCYCLSGGRGNGPWGGGAEGEMIENIAGAIAQWIVYGDTLLDTTGGFTKPNYVGRKAEAKGTEEPSGNDGTMDWRSFAVRKALNKYTNQVFYIGSWGGNRVFHDMNSEQYLLKVALSSIENTITGLNIRVGATNPPTYTSWIVETSDAAIRSNIHLEDFLELSRRVTREKMGSYSEKSAVQDQRMHIYGDNPMEFLAAGLRTYDWYKQAPTAEYLKSERMAREYLIDVGLRI